MPSKIYLVVSQTEGTVNEPIILFDLEDARRKADEVAGPLTRETDDVRVFEMDATIPGRIKVSTVYVPELPDDL